MVVPPLPIAAVVRRLERAGCIAAPEEAAELVAAAPDAAVLETMVRRREQGEPIPWIVGTTVFGGRRIRIDPGVYVPRFQTEELANRAAALLAPGGWAVDLCTGAGAIAAHLLAEVPAATVVGVDRDVAAAVCAHANGVPVVVADISRPVPLARAAGVAVVTAVAPYVPTADLAFLPADVQRYEPRVALDGGDDGLDLVRHVVRAAGELLRPGGWLLTEIGGDQDVLLGPALAAAGFADVEPWYDEDGDLRGIAARRAS